MLIFTKPASKIGIGRRYQLTPSTAITGLVLMHSFLGPQIKFFHSELKSDTVLGSNLQFENAAASEIIIIIVQLYNKTTAHSFVFCLKKPNRKSTLASSKSPSVFCPIQMPKHTTKYRLMFTKNGWGGEGGREVGKKYFCFLLPQ